MGMAGDESGPAVKAVAHLETLRGGEQDVEEVLQGTLLSPHCSRTKREAIHARLVRLADRLQAGGHEFEVLGERRDREYAAVLVAAAGRSNPIDVEIVPVGLRMEDEAWNVAPVPGSFENTNVAFDREVERQVAALEEWMGRERVVRLQGLQESAMKRLEELVERTRPDKLLMDGSPSEVVEQFLKACEGRELATTLVFCMEGLGEDELQELIGQLDRGLRGTGGRSWNDLTSPDVVRVIAREELEEGGALVWVLCYDPEERGGVKALVFDLMRVGGRWQIQLPKVLREPPGARKRWVRRTRKMDDLRKEFPECYERTRPVRRFGSMEEAGREIAALLREGTLDELFRVVCREDSMTEVEKRVAYAEAARLWKRFRKGDAMALHGSLVGELTEGSAGLAVLHPPMMESLSRLRLETVLFLKGADGWSLAPGVTIDGNFGAMPPRDLENQKKILARFAEQQEEFEKSAAETLAKRFEVLHPGNGEAVPKEEAGKLVRRFRQNLRNGNLSDALGLCGLINRPAGAREGLQALSYELRGAKQADESDRELLGAVHGAWTGVSLRVDSGPSDEPDYPLYLVVRGEHGPRIMVDAGLRLPTNAGRGILNDGVWKHLKDHLDEKEVAHVRALYEGHRQRALKDFESWEKSNKSSR